MASRYYGASVGACAPADVVKQGTSPGKAVEVVVDLAAANLDKLAVIKALLAITDYVIGDGFPPA